LGLLARAKQKEAFLTQSRPVPMDLSKNLGGHVFPRAELIFSGQVQDMQGSATLTRIACTLGTRAFRRIVAMSPTLPGRVDLTAHALSTPIALWVRFVPLTASMGPALCNTHVPLSLPICLRWVYCTVAVTIMPRVELKDVLKVGSSFRYPLAWWSDYLSSPAGLVCEYIDAPICKIPDLQYSPSSLQCLFGSRLTNVNDANGNILTSVCLGGTSNCQSGRGDSSCAVGQGFCPTDDYCQSGLLCEASFCRSPHEGACSLHSGWCSFFL